MMVYSGFTREELERGVLPYARALLAEADLLLDACPSLHKPGRLTKSRRNRVLALVPEVGKMLRRLRSGGPYLFQTCDGQAHIR